MSIEILNSIFTYLEQIRLFVYFLTQTIIQIMAQIDPHILATLAIALLTVLIPLAIVIFSDQKEFENLDRNVILDYIARAKYFLVYLGLIFLPLILWDISPDWFRLVAIIFWSIGMYLMLKILIKSYSWMKGNKFDSRFNYLNDLKKNLKSAKDIEGSWHSVWRVEKLNSQNEQEFWKIFSSTIEQFLEETNGNLQTTSKLLGDFDVFINNRSIHFLLSWSDDVFQKILEWHFKIWKEEKEYECLIVKGKSDEWRNYNEISRILGYSLKQIEKRAFQDQISPPIFFDVLEKHVKEYKEQFIKDKDGKDIYYVGFLFKAFYEVFFEVIENPSGRHSIWRHFPQEWKITVSNLSKEESVSWVSWRNFFNWAQGRIGYPKEDSDKNLSEVINQLFPEVEPVLWAIILIIVFSPDDENKVQSVIEKPWNFGAQRESSENKIKVNNAFELADLLFEDQFSEENLEKYIANLKILTHYKENKEENKRLQLLTLFEEMLKYKSSV